MAFAQTLASPSLNHSVSEGTGFPAPGSLEIEPWSGCERELEGPLRSELCYSHSLFLLKHESLFSDANFEKLVPIRSEQKHFGLTNKTWDKSLAFLAASWASASPPPLTLARSQRWRETLREANFVGCFPVIEYGESRVLCIKIKKINFRMLLRRLNW